MKYILFVIIFFFYGCHTLSLQTPSKSSLQKVFQEYWHARMKGEYKKSWHYELPSQRYIFTFDQYRRSLSDSGLVKVTMQKVKFIHPSIAIVDREVVYKDGLKTLKKDRWFYIDGRWFHKYYQNILPPSTPEEWIYQ